MITWFRRLLIARAIRRQLRSGIREAARADPAFAEAQLFVDRWIAGQVTARQPAAPGALPPGRQPIVMPSSGTNMFGIAEPWRGLIPPNAHEAAWEDCHTFAKGDRPVRDSVGIRGGPPIAFVCAGCDLAQPPIQTAERTCPYCGLFHRLHGSRLFWWRKAVEVAEWEPRR